MVATALVDARRDAVDVIDRKLRTAFERSIKDWTVQLVRTPEYVSVQAVSQKWWLAFFVDADGLPHGTMSIEGNVWSAIPPDHLRGLARANTLLNGMVMETLRRLSRDVPKYRDLAKDLERKG